MTDTTTRARATLAARADTAARPSATTVAEAVGPEEHPATAGPTARPEPAGAEERPATVGSKERPESAAPRESPAVDPVFAEAWELWHREHERRRTDPLGFLAIVGLYWLGAEPITVPGAPGRWHLGPEGPVVELTDGERLTHGEEVLTGTQELGTRLVDGVARFGFVDPTQDHDDVPATFGFCEVAVRSDGVILRPRRSDSVYLAQYTGTPAYPADPRWVLPARFVRHEQPVAVPVGSVIEGLDHEFPSPGTLEVELPSPDGPVRWSLTAFARDVEGGLSVLFRDLTSGVTTYGASRSVSVPAPGADGWTLVDLNRAVNLPCAYIDFATCPLPPAGNRLPVAVEAGEKLPPRRAASSPWEGALG